ncbi:hypothetical protein AXG93_3822s1150 [Marchantia polymorpha subsp. ruderalis]|uniref:Uncharacterized protein n=1 Tax=Marchantia polymorpha subsp. ruderalis TaxID=1480154 RepID=A0A176WK90_MARPO|nr:hypothetical protein AXG93_3822s1150 [Marchantia polymorpha subsp. ruderalis]
MKGSEWIDQRWEGFSEVCVHMRHVELRQRVRLRPLRHIKNKKNELRSVESVTDARRSLSNTIGQSAPLSVDEMAKPPAPSNEIRDLCVRLSSLSGSQVPPSQASQSTSSLS